MIGLKCGLSSQAVLERCRGERLVDSWLPWGLVTFHSARKVACFRDKLKRAVTAGKMLLTVPRSIWPEIRSGPDAVWVHESSFDTSSGVHDTPDRVGPLGALIGTSRLCESVWGVKQVEKNVDITHKSTSASTPTEKANLLINHFFLPFFGDSL